MSSDFGGAEASASGRPESGRRKCGHDSGFAEWAVAVNHTRSRQGICKARGGHSGVGASEILLPVVTSSLGTWHKREHQRATQGIFSERERSVGYTESLYLGEV